MSISIDLESYEVLDQLTTAELERELAGRTDRTREERSAIETALEQMRRGDYLDAITTLEREFRPKWRTLEDSKRAYVSAMVRLAA